MTAIHRGIVQIPADLGEAASTPLGNARARDGVLNGLLHIADSAGQVHVNWWAYDTTLFPSGYEGPLEPREDLVADRWQHIAAFTSRSRTSCVFVGGARYPLRVSLSGASSGAHGVRFLASINHDASGLGRSFTPAELAAVADDAFWESDLTGGTPAELGGASLGDLATSWLVHPRPGALVEGDAYDLDASTRDRKRKLSAPLHVDVFGRTANVASAPQLWGLTLAEYVGEW